MKKLLLPAYCFALSLFLITGCGKDDPEPAADTPVTPTPATPLTTEQNKANLQTTGVDFVKNISEVKNMSSLDVSNQFGSLVGKSAPFNKTEDVMAPIRILLALNAFQATGDVDVVYASMKTAVTDPSSPQDAFDQAKGTYSWKDSMWTKTAGSNIVLEFPSTASGTTNNASYTITYKGNTVAKPFTNYTGDLPEAVTGVLKVDGATLISFAFNATYGADGIPTNTTVALDINPFHFLLSVTATAPLVGYNFSLKKNTTVLLDYGVSAKGNFSRQNLETINDSTISKFEDITKVATSVDAHFQVLNIIVKGDINLQGLADSFSKIGGSETATKQQTISCINSNYNLGLYYASNNTSIAKTEFYLVTRTNTWEDWVYDPITYQYNPVTRTEQVEDLDIRFVFGDLSKSDMETYFKTGFDQVQTDFDNLITDLDTKYGN